MPRWPESTAPVCGAKTRSGGTCKHAPSPENRRCRMHGGASPAAVAKAKRIAEERNARKAVETYGLKLDIDPVTALLDEVQWTAGHVAWLRTKVQELEEATLVWGETERVDKGATEFTGQDITEAAAPNIWLQLYQKERTHLVNVCKAAISAGIEERRVRLAERQGDVIVSVLQKIFGDLNLTPEQLALVPQIVPIRLREAMALAA